MKHPPTTPHADAVAPHLHPNPQTCYRYGCRLEPCRTANMVYAAEHKRRHRQAQGRSRIPAAPATAHLRRLLAAGDSLARIATVSGLALRLVQSLSSGKPATTRPGNVAALLAISPVLGPDAIVDATITWRAATSLAALGYPTAWVGEHAPCSHSTLAALSHGATTVRYRTEQRLTSLAQRMASTPGPSPRVAQRARAAGWHTPWWYEPGWQPPAEAEEPDPLTLIDDARLLIARGAPLDPAALDGWALVIRYTLLPDLCAAGLSCAEIAHLLGVSARQIDRDLHTLRAQGIPARLLRDGGHDRTLPAADRAQLARERTAA